MDISKWKDKTMQLFKKYRYAVLVLLIGMFLMVFPTFGSQKNETDDTVVKQGITFSADITKDLTEMLSNMQGVGDVKVMLTFATGEQVIYQVDEDISTSENVSTIQKETVIISGSDRQEEALISCVKPPSYLGAIIVCQGADQPAVKLAVVDAVSKVTGLSSDKISVVKMK